MPQPNIFVENRKSKNPDILAIDMEEIETRVSAAWFDELQHIDPAIMKATFERMEKKPIKGEIGQGCKNCKYMQLKQEGDEGHCYMFRNAPTEYCELLEVV